MSASTSDERPVVEMMVETDDDGMGSVKHGLGVEDVQVFVAPGQSAKITSIVPITPDECEIIADTAGRIKVWVSATPGAEEEPVAEQTDEEIAEHQRVLSERLREDAAARRWGTLGEHL